MMTHQYVMTLSLRFKNSKIDKFGDFSCDINMTVGQTYFEMLFLILLINGDHMRPQGASGGHKVSASASKRNSLVNY